LGVGCPRVQEAQPHQIKTHARVVVFCC
jgi:hypothetical protein